MLYLIGTGLGDERDLTLRAVDILKKCSKVYFEYYTSIYRGDLKKLEMLIDKPIILADRKMIEVESDKILDDAKNKNVALLIMGDIFSATTHSDMVLRAEEKGIQVAVIHNASILTAIGDTGLSLYKFGRTASIPFLTDSWKVDSPYEILRDNKKNGEAHTLFLLDLKVTEKKTMTFNQAIEFLIEIESRKKEGLITNDTLVVGCCGLGFEGLEMFYGKLSDVLKKNSNVFPQCLIIPGKLHFIEEEMLERFKVE
jgi:diphthine synthase